jgi:preprotein translocase subunit YajC
MVWVLVALPQKRARSTQLEVLGQLKVGDEVVTVGGMIAPDLPQSRRRHGPA